MASFMPAEELDDYNSDDGFFMGDEEFLQDYLNVQDFKSTQEKPSAQIKRAGHVSEKRPQSLTFIKTNNDTSGNMFTLNSNEAKRKSGFERADKKKRFGGFGRSCHASGQTFFSQEDFKLAAVKGNIELVKKCLDQGMSVDEPLHNGWTALMYAANNAKPELVQFLLDSSANVNCHRDMYNCLMCACSSVNCEDNVLACTNLLIEKGADINAKDRYHTTPLMLASRGGKLETVKLLLEKGASVNSQDYRGWTALTMATQKSFKHVVMTLVEAGADCNIKHQDKLTVKDLAAHLPTDEMLALLEKRPYVACHDMNENNASASSDVPNYCLLDSTDSSEKTTDLRYGELELFLYGLELPHLLPVFRKELIDLPMLFTLTEKDLQNAGVEQVGARKKILDACQAIHKRNWETSSLVSIHFNKCISCADAIAMIANISKHIRYVASTATYVKEQLKRHPESVMQATDRVNSALLLKHVDDSMKNVNSLKEEIMQLHSELKTEMSRHPSNPVDLITFQKKKTSTRLRNFSLVIIALGSIGFIVWNKDKILHMVNR